MSGRGCVSQDGVAIFFRDTRRKRRFAWIAGAIAAVSLLGAPGAWAACAPTAPVSNATVTCGTTTNQNNPNGWGTGVENNNAITVTTNATLSGSQTGFNIGSGNSITVDTGATVQSTNAFPNNIGAIIAGGTITVTNLGTIQGNAGVGIEALSGDVTVTNNTGSISATGPALESNSGNVTVTANSGMVTSVSAAISAAGIANVTNGQNGTISSTGLGFSTIQAASVSVTNNGTIDQTNGGSVIFTLSSSATNNITNSGLISATGANSFALNTIGNLIVMNKSGGTIQATGTGADAIDSFGPTTITNDGAITGPSAIIVDNSVATPTTIFTSGTVNGTGGTAIAYSSTSTGNTLTLGPGFTITGTVSGGSSNILQLGGSTGSGTFDVGTIGSQYQNFTTFNKIDTSTWTLVGSGTQAWSVQGGTLLVDGTVGAVTVQTGGTLGGIGTVGPLVVNSGGAVAPGASTATLHVSGAVSFANGSFFQVTVDPVQSAKLVATMATTLGGGTVQVVAAGAGFVPITKYTILTSNGGVTGTFAGATSNVATLTPTLSYDTDDVFLTLTNTGFTFSSLALTPNQASVAAALDNASQNAALIQLLLHTPVGTIQQALDLFSGEVFGSTQSVILGDSIFARDVILARLQQMPFLFAPGPLAALGSGGPTLAYAPQPGAYASVLPVKAPPPAAAPAPDLVYWAQGVGAWGRINSDGNAAEATRDLAGFFTGFDRRFGDWRAGLAAGYTNASISIPARASSATVDTGHFAAYAGTSFGPWNLRTGADFAWNAIATSRLIAVPGIAETANAHFGAGEAQLFGELGYGVALGSIAAEPFAGLAVVHLRTDAFAESSGLAALDGAAKTQDVGYSTLGARFAINHALANGMTLTPRFSAAWQHAFGDVDPVTALTFQTLGTSFTTTGVPIARDSALVDAGVDLRVAPQATVGLFYQGELARSAQDHSVRGSFTWQF